ncbi:phospholipid scramblase 2 isoform X3 [Puntigrus tetrazona]|uniref:phospholipid scramblase 2 isoform X3 n=1 Tax=Puntigrus tetrazona TaxID=1606681 RepID=UPI001C89C360|nr:phospholipid scramblase 2 isoform X3 [Puntigrus tetrazona]
MSEPAESSAAENLPPPVQLDLNQSDPKTDQVQPYGGLQPDDQSEPIYEAVLEDHEEHTYMCPDPVLQPAESQPTPVQPVMDPSVQINTVPCMIQPYKGYPVQSYLPNAIPQTAGPGQVPPVNSQPVPVQTVMNPSSPTDPVPHKFQSYTGPEPVSLAAFPVQTVMNPSSLSNPAAPQVQSLTVQMPQLGQHISAYPVGGNHPPPVRTVLDQSSPAPVVPPAVLLFGVPPGLEYLTQIDQILIHQKMECLETLTGYETNNQYEIKNSIGQEIYHAKEESDCLIRNLFGPAHGFKMHIKNNMDQEVIQLHRPMRCFLQEIEVQAPPGVTIGYVKQEWSFLPKFFILGPNYEQLLKIQGPFLPFKCFGEIDFEVISIIGEQSIGRITKQRSGLLKKCISDASNFCIQFPLDMDVKMKAILLGACLFIDILFFDKGGFVLLKFLK